MASTGSRLTCRGSMLIFSFRTWSEEDKANWTVVDDGYQKFYDYWRGDFDKSKFLQEFPYTLLLGMDKDDRPFFPLPDQSWDQIVVTEAYEKMYHDLLLMRTIDKGSHKGAAITGQPGIGTPLI